MPKAAPPELPGGPTAESPVDRALALSLADEKHAALRWAAALVASDSAMPSGLLLTGRLLADLTRLHLLRVRPGRRWDMHDLVRIYAAEHAHADADRYREALVRLLEYYTSATTDAERRFRAQKPVAARLTSV